MVCGTLFLLRWYFFEVSKDPCLLVGQTAEEILWHCAPHWRKESGDQWWCKGPAGHEIGESETNSGVAAGDIAGNLVLFAGWHWRWYLVGQDVKFRLVKFNKLLGRLGAGCGGLPSSGLALLLLAWTLRYSEAGCDHGILSWVRVAFQLWLDQRDRQGLVVCHFVAHGNDWIIVNGRHRNLIRTV